MEREDTWVPWKNRLVSHESATDGNWNKERIF